MYTYAATALVAAVLAAAGTWQVQDWRYEAREADRLREEAKDQLRRSELGDQAATRHEADKKRIETKYRTVTKEVIREVEKPVYRNVCIGPDGLRILSNLIDGQGASEPAGTVSEPRKAD